MMSFLYFNEFMQWRFVTVHAVDGFGHNYDSLVIAGLFFNYFVKFADVVVGNRLKLEVPIFSPSTIEA